MSNKTDKRILQTLADLAGRKFNDENIAREGTRLIIPESMTPERAVKTLQAHIEAMEEETRFTRTFNYRPWDGAAAFHRAIRTLTGTSGVGKAAFSFFGKRPPESRSIDIDYGKSATVPWGMIGVELFEGTVYLTGEYDVEKGALFTMVVDAPKKYEGAIQGLFELVQKELDTGSIYRGKAFDGADDPSFLDLRSIRDAALVYSDDVQVQLDANIWSLLNHTEAMRKNGLPLKRAILLHGPYGTGKTMAAFKTAEIAVDNGWTFVYCRPGKDDIHAVMQTARLYQPAVVFFEDVDTISDPTVMNGNSNDSVTRLLDTFDGITAKGTELVAILTTNHPEKIHKGMVRPGRLDAVIEVGDLDEAGVGRMIESLVPEGDLDANLDLTAIFTAMEGYQPAYVKEAIDRAVRYSIARNNGDLATLTTEDFVRAAEGLRPQLDMMLGANEHSQHITIEDMISTRVDKNIDVAAKAIIRTLGHDDDDFMPVKEEIVKYSQ